MTDKKKHGVLACSKVWACAGFGGVVGCIGAGLGLYLGVIFGYIVGCVVHSLTCNKA